MNHFKKVKVTLDVDGVDKSFYLTSEFMDDPTTRDELLTCTVEEFRALLYYSLGIPLPIK